MPPLIFITFAVHVIRENKKCRQMMLYLFRLDIYVSIADALRLMPLPCLLYFRPYYAYLRYLSFS